MINGKIGEYGSTLCQSGESLIVSFSVGNRVLAEAE